MADQIVRRTQKLCICLWLLLLPYNLMADEKADESDLITALIYKLINFVDWPEIELSNEPNFFGICVLGEDTFVNSLSVLKNRIVKDRQIQVYNYRQSENIDNLCQIVFVEESKSIFMDSIINNLKIFPILTISTIEDFAIQGGIVEFSFKNDRINFLINLNNAQDIGLDISAPLLEMATIVKSK